MIKVYINVYDDTKGTVFHTIFGCISYFHPKLFILFFFYEFIEHLYLNHKEKEANFLGDVVEFLIAFAATGLIFRW